MFIKENPDDTGEGLDYKDLLNPDSLKAVTGFIEPSVMHAKPMDKFQFERIGYFCVDKDSIPEKLIFNLTVTLRDSWSKIEKNQ